MKQQDKEFGFGKTEVKQQRLVTKEGKYNFIRKGLPLTERFNIYHYLINASSGKFLVLIFVWYTVVNLFFTALYYLVGIQHLTGIIQGSALDKFYETYFFSAQTLTTVGYGRINPTGAITSLIASLEALVGLLSFALITGLVYGRFSKPKTKIRFSNEALISPYKDHKAFMFRIANFLDSNMMNATIRVNVSIVEQGLRKFYILALERDSIQFFPSTWTVVHPIDENSPFGGMTPTQFQDSKPEFMILFQAFDDTFNQNIYARASYTTDEIKWGGKFINLASVTEDGYPVVDFSRIDVYDSVEDL
jgi:inward rectifier potassium channel